MTIKGLTVATGDNGKGQLKATSTDLKDKVLFTTQEELSSTTLANLNLSVTLPEGTDGSKYGKLTQEDGKVKMTIDSANINDADRTHHGNTLEEAYGQKKDSTQDLTLYVGTSESGTTTLNTYKVSESETATNLTLSSDDETNRVIKGTKKNESTGKLEPIIKSEATTTNLIFNNVELDGYAVEATGNLVLSGKNITMNHTSGSLNSDYVVKANAFYLNNAEVTFYSNVNANTIVNNSTLNIGGSSVRDVLTVKGDLTVNGMVINMDVFGANASVNDAFVVAGNFGTLQDMTINLNWAGTGTPALGDTIEVTFTDTGRSKSDEILKSINSYYFHNFTYDSSNGTIHGEVNPNAVPEPSTMLLLILGAAGMMWLKRRETREARSEKK